MKLSFLALAAALVAAVIAFPAAAAGTTVVYDNTPHPLPGNLVSWAFEATGTSEFGDRVGLAAGPRQAATATVVLSSWACQAGSWNAGDCVSAPGATFTHPITLNIYAVGAGNAPGALLGTVTQTFAIPYRPSADPVNCTGGNAGKWFEAASSTCFNGKAAAITFDLASLSLTLPDEVIVSVAFNTTHYGYAPIGAAACSSTPAGCPYDSLNVAIVDPATTLTVGTNPAPDDAYQDTDHGSCTNGPLHPFSLEAGCWTASKPAIQITTTSPLVGPPTDKGQCKNGGWKTFDNPSFKSQKACEKFVKEHRNDDEHGNHGNGSHDGNGNDD
jgi:hypothetical protein